MTFWRKQMNTKNWAAGPLLHCAPKKYSTNKHSTSLSTMNIIHSTLLIRGMAHLRILRQPYTKTHCTHGFTNLTDLRNSLFPFINTLGIVKIVHLYVLCDLNAHILMQHFTLLLWQWEENSITGQSVSLFCDKNSEEWLSDDKGTLHAHIIHTIYSTHKNILISAVQIW